MLSGTRNRMTIVCQTYTLNFLLNICDDLILISFSLRHSRIIKKWLKFITINVIKRYNIDTPVHTESSMYCTEMSYKVISVKRSPASLSTLNVYLSEKVPRSLTRLAVNEMCSI